jgi:hypothetical protein
MIFNQLRLNVMLIKQPTGKTEKGTIIVPFYLSIFYE